MRDNHSAPAQIEEHVRETYLAHLPARLAHLRELFLERQWRKLKAECEKLGHGADNHGLHELAALARTAVEKIPNDMDTLMTYSLDDESRIALGILFQSTGEETN
jgi:hypothetical protein